MKKLTRKNIPNRLRKFRRVRGLTQKEVAQILGLKSASIISRWENGATLPSFINALRLAAIYRSLVDALFLDFLRSIRREMAEREEALLREPANSQVR